MTPNMTLFPVVCLRFVLFRFQRKANVDSLTSELSFSSTISPKRKNERKREKEKKKKKCCRLKSINWIETNQNESTKSAETKAMRFVFLLMKFILALTRNGIDNRMQLIRCLKSIRKAFDLVSFGKGQSRRTHEESKLKWNERKSNSNSKRKKNKSRIYKWKIALGNIMKDLFWCYFFCLISLILGQCGECAIANHTITRHIWFYRADIDDIWPHSIRLCMDLGRPRPAVCVRFDQFDWFNEKRFINFRYQDFTKYKTRWENSFSSTVVLFLFLIRLINEQIKSETEFVAAISFTNRPQNTVFLHRSSMGKHTKLTTKCKCILQVLNRLFRRWQTTKPKSNEMVLRRFHRARQSEPNAVVVIVFGKLIESIANIIIRLNEHLPLSDEKNGKKANVKRPNELNCFDCSISEGVKQHKQSSNNNKYDYNYIRCLRHGCDSLRPAKRRNEREENLFSTPLTHPFCVRLHRLTIVSAPSSSLWSESTVPKEWRNNKPLKYRRRHRSIGSERKRFLSFLVVSKWSV